MKVGVVGCGYWGPNLVRNLIATHRCESVSCYDVSPKALHQLLGRFPSATPATSLDDMLGQVDAVMIATPVKSHYALAKRVLSAGKGVFVEKPLTASYAEAAELVELGKRQKLAVMTGHTFLYSPAVRKIQHYIADGTLGEVFSVSSQRVNLGIHRQDVNVIWDLAPHDLSMLLYWLRESPARVSALGRACVGRNIDFASLHLEFLSGVVACVEVNWLAPNKLRQTRIVGSNKMVVFDDTHPSEKIKLYDSGATIMPAPNSFGEYQLAYRNGDLISPCLESAEPLLEQTHAFLDWVEYGVEAEANTWIALQVVAAMEAACRSLVENGRLVEVRGSTFANLAGPAWRAKPTAAD